MTTEMMEEIAHNGQISRQQTKIRKMLRKKEKPLKSGQLRKHDAKNIGLIRI
jgi:hypothetical protein